MSNANPVSVPFDKSLKCAEQSQKLNEDIQESNGQLNVFSC